MTLLNDTEKVTFLISALDSHIGKLPRENAFKYYLESIRSFLKTKDSINQKVAFSNSELFIESISHNLDNPITLRQAIGTLIAAFDKIGYMDSMDAAAIILVFGELLNQITFEEAEEIYNKRWATDG